MQSLAMTPFDDPICNDPICLMTQFVKMRQKVEQKSHPKWGRISAIPMVGGLHHHYARRADFMALSRRWMNT